jgi:Tfp pilus assembly protein PilO
MADKEKQVIIMVILLSILGGVFGYKFLILPKIDEMHKLDKEIEILNNKVEKNKLTKDEKSNDLEGYSILEYINNNKIDSLITGRDIPRLFNELYWLLSLNNLTCSTMNFSENNKEEELPFFMINFTANGENKNIINFVKKLEENFLISTSQIEINIGEEGEEKDFDNSAYSISIESESVLKISMKAYFKEDDFNLKDYDFLQGSYGTREEVFELFNGIKEE